MKKSNNRANNVKAAINDRVGTQAEVANWLGVDASAIKEAVKAGCDCKTPGGRFRLAPLQGWFERKPSGKGKSLRQQMDEQKLRELKAKADLKEIQAAERRGELMAMDAARVAMQKMAQVAKNRLLDLPSNLRIQAAVRFGLSDAQCKEFEELANKLVNAICRQIKDDPFGES